MSKTALVFRSYISTAALSDLAQRIPAIMIALWLGVISVSMIPHMNIVEGGFLFLFFFTSCFLIDSILNPKKIKNQRIAKAIRTIGHKNYLFLVSIHILLTIMIAFHLSFIISKYQLLLVVLIGLGLNLINSRLLSRSTNFSHVPSITNVIGGITLPMVGAFYIVGNELDLFSISIIGAIGIIYLGLDIFGGAKSDLEIAPEKPGSNSIEWEAMSIANQLDLPNSRIKEIAIQLYNIRNEDDFSKVPPEKCALFLPHCLRVAETCKASYNEEGLQCKHCNKDCKINVLTRAAEQLGYKCFVVPGGAMVFNISKKYNPGGVVAVACPNELSEGTERTESEYKVPFQIIPLTKDGCVNTDVCTDDVIKVLDFKLKNASNNN